MKNETNEFKGNKFRKGKKKGGKVSSSRRTTETRETVDVDTNPRTNDVSWYTINDQLLRDAGSLSFNNPLGNSTRITELTQSSDTLPVARFESLDNPVPGLMAINYMPTIGPSRDNYSPINIASRHLFGIVRKFQSGKWNYQAADLMKYILALDSCYMMFSWMCRIYGVAKVYSAVNRYWPDAVLKACHVDRNDVLANLADLRYYINTFAHRLNTLCAPSGIKLFDRHFFMNMGVWKDSPSDKAQMYIFKPEFLYFYEEMNTADVPAELQPIRFEGAGGSYMKVSDIISIAEEMVQKMMRSEDIGVISGDLFKVYGEGNSHKVNMIDENFEVYPTYDPIVLEQIHNIRGAGVLDVDVSKYKITELTSQDGNAGALVQNITLNLGELGVDMASTPVQNFAHVLDFNCDLAEISPALVMEGTRLTALGTVTKSDTGVQVYMDVYGSELVTKFQVYSFATATGEVDLMLETTNGVMTMNEAMKVATMLSSFDRHPIVFTCEYKGTTNTFGLYNLASAPYIYDVNTYSIVGKTALRKLHESALLALLNMPAMGQ